MASPYDLGLIGADEMGSPAAPQLPPAGNSPTSGNPHLLEVLKKVLPLIAAGIAAKKGGMGGFGAFEHGQMQGAQFNAQQAHQGAQLDLQKQHLAAQQQQFGVQQAHQFRMEAAQEHAAAAVAAREQHRIEQEQGPIIWETLERLKETNPDFASKLVPGEAEKRTINVPGIGSLNLAEAVARQRAPTDLIQDETGTYVPKRAGIKGYHPEPAPKAPALITDETNTRVEDRLGIHPYRPPVKPDKPVKEPKPTRHISNVKDDDPASDTFGKTFRIVTDENGNEISNTEVKVGGTAPATKSSAPVPSGGKFIEALDAQGNIHHAPAGTALPAGWKLK